MQGLHFTLIQPSDLLLVEYVILPRLKAIR